MNKWLKLALGLIAGLVLIVAIGSYTVMKQMGIIRGDNYDTVVPALPEISRPAVLVFSKTNGFVHEEALPAADAMFTDLANELGWSIYLTKNGAVHDPDLLQQFDAVIWNNVSGDVLTDSQRQALRSYIENGGSWLGLHGSGGDPYYHWDWYVDVLVGAQFVGHTMDPQFQDAELLPADGGGELVDHLPPRWRIAAEEWYAFDQNPRDKGYEIVLSIDESSYITTGQGLLFNDRMEGEHPLVWRHEVGEGRAFYSAIGHAAQTYSLTEHRGLWRKAMLWAVGASADASAVGLDD